MIPGHFVSVSLICLQDLAAREGRKKSYSGVAAWEAKAIAVISEISDPEVL